MTLDRSERPSFKLPLEIPEIQLNALDSNGQHWLNHQIDAKVSKIEVSFPKPNKEVVKGSYYILSKLLLEGTKNRSKEDFHDKLDACGSFLDVTSSKDYISMTLHALNRKIEESYQLFLEVIQEPRFEEDTFNTVIEREKQNIAISLEKSSSLAQINFEKRLFENAPHYTPIESIDELNIITLDDVKEAWQFCIKQQTPFLFITSNTDLSTFSNSLGSSPIEHNSLLITSDQSFKKTIDKTDAMQSAIRLGANCISQKHEDFFGLSFTNTLFGGYFGSRLMQNIREDKGYTYGIYSSIRHLNSASYWVIGADVKKEHREDAVTEIRSEIKKLQESPINQSEVDTVRNYLKGDLLSSVASPFDVTSRWKSIILRNLDRQYFSSYYASLDNNSPQTVADLTQKHFDLDKLSEIIVG